MKKKIDMSLVITTIICLLPIILSLVMYEQLPEQIAIHFDGSGNPDNYAPKALAAFGLPALMAALNVFNYFLRNNDPKKANSSFVLKQFGKWIIPAISVILVPITLFIAIGISIPIHIVVPAVVGVIVIACGNYLPKCKQNYTVGIKLPWTLNSEENWNKVHHMAGYLWMIVGMCMVISSFLKLYWMPTTFIVVIILVGVPRVYSYVLYKKGY